MMPPYMLVDLGVSDTELDGPLRIAKREAFVFDGMLVLSSTLLEAKHAG